MMPIPIATQSKCQFLTEGKANNTLKASIRVFPHNGTQQARRLGEKVLLNIIWK